MATKYSTIPKRNINLVADANPGPGQYDSQKSDWGTKGGLKYTSSRPQSAGGNPNIGPGSY